MKSFILKAVVEILDVFFLYPFWKTYFEKRISALLVQNLGRQGMGVVTYNKRGRVKYGFVFKYPYIKKVIVDGNGFDVIFPGVIMKLITVSKQGKVK